MKRLLIINHFLIYNVFSLVLRYRSVNRTCTCTGAAVDALIGFDNVHAVSGRDGISRTFVSTCATVDA